MDAKSYHLIVVGFGDRIRRYGVLRVRASPDIDLVHADRWVRAGLVRSSVIARHVQPCYKVVSCLQSYIDCWHTSVVHAIDPCLRIRLGAMNGSDVVGFAVVVPCINLDEIEHVAVGNDVLPTCVVQV